MKILGVIPARYASSRFPGKPLADIRGMSMIRRVYTQARKATQLNGLVVATDDQRILNHVREWGGEVVLTRSDHENGTARCGEVAANIDADYYINIQGDEPFIHPEQIDALAALLDGHTELATLVKVLAEQELLDNPNVMKVVLTKNREALYFSRQAIPYVRDYPKTKWLSQHQYYKHIGIYAYRKDILEQVISWPKSPLETAESLEQLRWLENGLRIKVALTQHDAHGVDVPEDIKKVMKRFPYDM